VAVAASIAGDISQDLKAGFLLGATPQKQQGSELFGAFSSAFFIAAAVFLLGESFGFGSEEIPAPQATLMKTVVDGVLQADLPWSLVLIGASFAIVAELLSVPSLPFSVGIYLPLSTMSPVFVGGLIRRLVDSHRKTQSEDIAKKQTKSGVLLSSGLIAGEGVMGVLIAAYAFFSNQTPSGFGFGFHGLLGEIVSFGIFLALGFYLFRIATRKRN
jgi:putative OPT family oligopeptide transporter